MRKLTMAGIIFLIVGALPAPAFAHTEMVSSNPKAGSISKVMPKSGWIEFSEKLMTVGNKNPNTLQFFDSQGKEFDLKDSKVNGRRISVSLSPKMSTGTVTVKYRVVAADGHPVQGSFTYTCKS